MVLYRLRKTNNISARGPSVNCCSCNLTWTFLRTATINKMFCGADLNMHYSQQTTSLKAKLLQTLREEPELLVERPKESATKQSERDRERAHRAGGGLPQRATTPCGLQLYMFQHWRTSRTHTYTLRCKLEDPNS